MTRQSLLCLAFSFLSSGRRWLRASDTGLGVWRGTSTFQLAFLRLLQPLSQQLLILGCFLTFLCRSSALLCQTMTLALQHQRCDKTLDLWSLCTGLLAYNQPLTTSSNVHQYTGLLVENCSWQSAANYIVLLRLSKSLPKPRFFGKTEPNRNRGFMPLCWRFRKRSCSSVLTVPWRLTTHGVAARVVADCAGGAALFRVRGGGWGFERFLEWRAVRTGERRRTIGG